MNSLGHGKFGIILAANARVKGMVAENMQRQALGQSMAYTSSDFEAEAMIIEDAARDIMNNGWQKE